MSYVLLYFKEQELACRHCNKRGCTDELKAALDDYRRLVGLPVIVDDAYRCVIHNQAVSLVAKSQHPLGIAADIKVPGLTLQEMYNAAKRIPVFLYGGIGVYDAGFIHVDVRDGRARWAFIKGLEQPISALITE